MPATCGLGLCSVNILFASIWLLVYALLHSDGNLHVTYVVCCMQLVLGQTLESIWGKQQLVRDRAWCMKQKGKPVGLSFEGLAIAESVYYT